MKIAHEAVKDNSAFTLEDRIGLVYDALALAKAGYLNVSSILSLYDVLRHEKECECVCIQAVLAAHDLKFQIWYGVALLALSDLLPRLGTRTKRLSPS